MQAQAWLPRFPTPRSQLQGRGRSAVLWCVVGFVALQAAYHPLSARWPQLFDGEYGHKHANLRAQVAARAPGQPCVVMLGSSLTGFALNPASMSTLRPGTPAGPVVYNFGINSSGPVVQLLCLHRLLADGIRPDLVLVEIHPWFLFYRYNHIGGKHYLPQNRLGPQDLPVVKQYDPAWQEMLPAWRRRQWLPWYYQRANLQNNFVPKWPAKHLRDDVWDFTDRYGWEGRLAERRRRGVAPPEAQRINVRYDLQRLNASVIDETFVRAYREVLSTCREEKIPTILVRMPETSCLRQEMTPPLQAQVEERFSALSRESGVPIVDARAWVPDTLFTDGFHLQPSGSEVFSQRLERECLIPFLHPRGGRIQLAATNASPK